MPAALHCTLIWDVNFTHPTLQQYPTPTHTTPPPFPRACGCPHVLLDGDGDVAWAYREKRTVKSRRKRADGRR